MHVLVCLCALTSVLMYIKLRLLSLVTSDLWVFLCFCQISGESTVLPSFTLLSLFCCLFRPLSLYPLSTGVHLHICMFAIQSQSPCWLRPPFPHSGFFCSFFFPVISRRGPPPSQSLPWTMKASCQRRFYLPEIECSQAGWLAARLHNSSPTVGRLPVSGL